MTTDDGIGFFSVLDNDTPAPGQTLTVKSIIEEDSTAGCAVDIDLLLVLFLPDPGFTGTAICVYEACDSTQACDEATLTVTVT